MNYHYKPCALFVVLSTILLTPYACSKETGISLHGGVPQTVDVRRITAGTVLMITSDAGFVVRDKEQQAYKRRINLPVLYITVKTNSTVNKNPASILDSIKNK